MATTTTTIYVPGSESWLGSDARMRLKVTYSGTRTSNSTMRYSFSFYIRGEYAATRWGYYNNTIRIVITNTNATSESCTHYITQNNSSGILGTTSSYPMGTSYHSAGSCTLNVTSKNTSSVPLKFTFERYVGGGTNGVNTGWTANDGSVSSTIYAPAEALLGYKVEFNRNNGSYTPLGATTSQAIGFTTEAQSGYSNALSVTVLEQRWKTIRETFKIIFKGENDKILHTHADTKCTTPKFDRWERTVGGTDKTTYNTNPPSSSAFTITNTTNFAVYPKGASDNTITWEKGGTCNLTSVAQPKKASTKIENNFYTITFVNADSSMPQITNLPAPLKSYKIQSYTFDGWYDNNDTKKSGTIDYSKTTTGSWTYTAKWIPDSAEYEQITLPFLSVDDYTFLGWIEESNNSENEQGNGSLDPEGKAQYYQGGQSFIPTKSMTLVPIWSKNAWVNISQIIVGAPEEITTTENVNFNINKLDINILKQLPAEIKPHAFYLLKTFSVCDNLDNPMPTGLYQYHGTVENLFNNSTSCYVLHFSMGYGNSSGRAQILIPHNASTLLNNIYIRIYLTNDNAPLWTPWKTINLT